jgi:hypothetical protein
MPECSCRDYKSFVFLIKHKTSLPQAVGTQAELPDGTKQVIND